MYKLYFNVSFLSPTNAPNDFSYHKTKDGSLAELVRKRYQSFDSELGAQIEVKYSITQPHPPPHPLLFPRLSNVISG